LAEGLAKIPGMRIDAARVVTNIVSFEIDPAAMDAGTFQKACAERGLRISRYLGNSPRLRAVTHVDVSGEDIDAAIAIARAVLVGTNAPVGAAR
jgi:threonine aldolase